MHDAGARGFFCCQATPKLFIGAELGSTFEVKRYIESGAFGRGWVCEDKKAKKNVFLKTFRSKSDRPSPCDPK